MTKNFKITLFIFLVVAAFFWLLGAFVSLEPNPLGWTLNGRAVYALLTTCVWLWLTALALN